MQDSRQVDWNDRNNPNQWHNLRNLSDIMLAWYPEKIVLESRDDNGEFCQRWDDDKKTWERFEPEESDRSKYISFRHALSVTPSERHLIVQGLSSNRFNNTFIGLHEGNHFTSLFKLGRNYLYSDSFGSDANTKKHVLDLIKQIDEKNPPTQSEKNIFTSLQAHLQNDSWHCGDWCFIPMLAFMKYGQVDKAHIEKFVDELGDGDIAKIRKINILLSIQKGENVTKDELEAFVREAKLNTNAMEIVNAHMQRIDKPALDKSCFIEPKVNKPIKIAFLNDLNPSTSTVECSINLPTGSKIPNAKTGQTFNLLTKESIVVYQAALKDVATVEWKEKDKCLLVKPNDKSSEIEVYANHMTLLNPTESGLKIMVDAYIAAVENAIKCGNTQVKKELWIDAEDDAATFLSNYCRSKGYTIVDKPEIQPNNKANNEDEPDKPNTKASKHLTSLKF